MKWYKVKLTPAYVKPNDHGVVVHLEISATNRRMLRRRLRDYFQSFIVLDIKAKR